MAPKGLPPALLSRLTAELALLRDAPELRPGWPKALPPPAWTVPRPSARGSRRRSRNGATSSLVRDPARVADGGHHAMTDSARPYRNPVRERLRAGQPALGLGVRMCRSADIARIARGSGHDFLFIDTQHAVFDIETITHIAQAADALGIAPIVRVRSLGDPDVPLLLDNGVTGIVFPDISTADQARRAVEIVRFPPVGRRSVAGGYAQFDYRAVPLAEATRRLDEGTLLAVMIETPKGSRTWRRSRPCRASTCCTSAPTTSWSAWARPVSSTTPMPWRRRTG
jgi:hypothetical protein